MSNKDREESLTVEGNKLIAEFLGGEVRETWRHNDFIQYTWTGAFVKEWRGKIGMPVVKEYTEMHILTDMLEFHSSWGWLMAVIEKIADTPMEDFINEETEDGGYAYPTTFGMRNENGEWMVRFRGHGLHSADTLIEAAWEACVDFIQFHNAQNPLP